MLNPAEIHAELGARRKDYALSHALYCDEGVYNADLAQIFYREWLFAAPAVTLPKAGAFLTLQVGAYPVVLTRGNDGMIRAFHNVCRHRGQRLCAKETGSGPKLVCPYHQWTYDLDGKLQYARDMQERFNPAEHGLKKVHCVDLGGMVFICLAQVPPPIAELAKTAMTCLAPSGLKDTKAAVAKRLGTMPFNDAGSLLFYHYPNTWNHFLGDHAITFRVLPISATETQVTTTWLVHRMRLRAWITIWSV